MEEQKTVYKRNLSMSVGAGLKSVMGSAKRSYFTLEHLVSSKYHQAGEKQEIIVDQIELGRDEKCQVRFDAEHFPTVSRRHASIMREGDNWKLIHLSTSNKTFVNGKVTNECVLQSGDEIKLSEHGPVVKFKKEETVNNLGFTHRLSLYGKQALKPLKTTIQIILGCILILVIGVIVVFYLQNRELKQLEARTAEQVQEIDSLNARNKELAQLFLNNKDSINLLLGEMDSIKARESKLIDSVITRVTSNGINNEAIDKCIPNIYYVITTAFDLTLPNGKKVTLKPGDKLGNILIRGWTGTGFLLSDGRFVTARHVVEGWYYNPSELGMLMLMNLAASNGGQVTAHFSAISSSGKKLIFTSDLFTVNRTSDTVSQNEDGTKTITANIDNTDFAFFKTDTETGLNYNAEKSKSLGRGDKLTVLGFPHSYGANSPTDISPIYGSGIVAANGLHRGVILTTDTNFEEGNSGGPVFYTNSSGELEVIGIVSAIGIEGSKLGFIVPISMID